MAFLLNYHIMPNILQGAMPSYSVSAGTANLVQAYHEVKAKINQAITFVRVYQRTNRRTFNRKDARNIREDLSATADMFLQVFRSAVLENVGTEIDNGDCYL